MVVVSAFLAKAGKPSLSILFAASQYPTNLVESQ